MRPCCFVWLWLDSLAELGRVTAEARSFGEHAWAGRAGEAARSQCTAQGLTQEPRKVAGKGLWRAVSGPQRFTRSPLLRKKAASDPTAPLPGVPFIS